MNQKILSRFGACCLFAAMLLVASCAGKQGHLLSGQVMIDRPITYAEMNTLLDRAIELPHVSVSVEGVTPEGRNIHLVHFSHGKHPDPFKLFFIGVQHGDEPAGKDALILLMEELMDHPERLPRDVDLYILPMANPDGTERDNRRTSTGQDLNRDHISMTEEETRVMHRITRRILPHITVDCHEYTRDSARFTRHGWERWPLIMMDTANSPIWGREIYSAGLRWINDAAPLMEAAGYTYMRYHVGDTPLDGELRYSTLEADDARNGLAAYGGLSFIIESGVNRSWENPNANLADRVNSYLILLRHFLYNDTHRAEDRAIVERARAASVPRFIPTNAFWGSNGVKITHYPVREVATGNTVYVPTANFMTDIIVKGTVPAPKFYVIDAGDNSEYELLLFNHGFTYDVLSEATTFAAEGTRLLRVENDWDDLYHRFSGRQITQRGRLQRREFPAGALVVSFDQPHSRRIINLLEPNLLYGLYRFDNFLATVGEDGAIPVWRVME